MGKGGYLGGSTIINTWGGGWSRDELEIISVKKSKNKKSGKSKKGKKKADFQTAMNNYAFSCARLEKKGRSWGVVPNIVRTHFGSDRKKIEQAVKATTAYQNGLNNKSMKYTPEKVQPHPKPPQQKQDNNLEIHDLIAHYANDCAIRSLWEEKWAEPPEAVKSHYQNNITFLKNSIKSHSAYLNALRKSEKNG